MKCCPSDTICCIWALIWGMTRRSPSAEGSVTIDGASFCLILLSVIAYNQPVSPNFILCKLSRCQRLPVFDRKLSNLSYVLKVVGQTVFWKLLVEIVKKKITCKSLYLPLGLFVCSEHGKVCRRKHFCLEVVFRIFVARPQFMQCSYVCAGDNLEILTETSSFSRYLKVYNPCQE